MDYKFENDFHKSEMLGRWALGELQALYPNQFKYKIEFTEYQYDGYDAYFFVMCSETLSIKKRVIIEIKVRDKVFNGYILETKKYNALQKKRNDLNLSKEECSLVYINFTPEGVIMWDLDKVDLDRRETITMNRRTVESTTDKVDKTVVLLHRQDAVGYWDYIFHAPTLLNRHYTQKYILPRVEKKLTHSKGIDFLD